MLDAFIIEKIKERKVKEEQQDNRIPLYIEEDYPEELKDKEQPKKDTTLVVIQL